MREVSSPSLSSLSSIRLGGSARRLYLLEEKNDLAVIPEMLSRYGPELFIIGRGSNLIARDGDLPITLLKIAYSESPEIIDEKDGLVFVKAGAGTSLATLSGFCLRHGLSGLEGLCGIPASLGGAVAMNAGSMGTQIADRLAQLTVATPQGFVTVKKSQLSPRYRHLEIAGIGPSRVYVEAILALTRRAKDGIYKTMHLNFLTKKSRQPIFSRTAGCVFKNPAPDVSAGKLLDMAGLRGVRSGGMSFSAMHANFLVNEGDGCARSALGLISQAKDKVRRKFGYDLELEVKIIPCPLS